MEKAKIYELIGRMTLEEKASYVSGADFWHTDAIERLGIPAVMVSDGPHGLRKQDEEGDHLGVNDSIEAVCFPAACATACSFDRDMMYAMGADLGKECQAENVSTLLGPAVNIKRSPLCGRNFEYVSEDPYAAGELSAAYIRGVQSQNVGTSIKHFAANNQEYERMNGSSNMDERTLREIYLPAFETAVKTAQPWTVMCSYNKVNGEYSSQNHRLLTEILRDEWGFEGYVMSDWGAVSDRVKGVNAGLDLEMPGSNGANDALIIEAVKNGTIKEETLDECVYRILNIVFRYEEGRQKEVFDREADHEKSAAYAERCMVLLKNEGVLPLKAEETAAFIGGFAEKPRYQGGGSSHINSHRITSALSLAEEYGKILYAEGFPADKDEYDDTKVEKAIETARQADKIVVFAGLPDSFESEGYDRSHMQLPACQNRLIGELLLLGKPVIVVLHNGSPVEMPWADQVSGILEAYLAGEAAGKAEMEILYGRVNPSGKLSETFPLRLQDNPSYLNFPGRGKQVNYAEGIFVGYRYYDSKEMEVRFPFGHGLSYTTFAYSNLRVDKETFAPGDIVKVSLDVTNTGSVSGREIVQLYVSDKTDVAVRPVKELKNFASVELSPGETKTVCMELNDRSFSWYNTEKKDWFAANGVYDILIGASSRDIRLCCSITREGAEELIPVIDQDVMMGDLFNCKKTAGFVKNMMEEYFKMFGEQQSSEAAQSAVTDEMAINMQRFMPLRALRSFSAMTNEDVSRIVEALKKVVSE